MRSGDVRGRGFFIGLEFVADQSKKTFASTLGLHQRIRSRSLDNGLICYPMGGNVDGVAGDTVICRATIQRHFCGAR
jgi:adenosylmethionine-8-amino-7-oxononanoate aminotransferase